MLLMNHVTKKYGSFLALEDVNLEFGTGVYGLLAPNGAGKTTLIKMLATLLFPTSGEILYDGIDIIELDEEYRDIIGYLPQEFGYYKEYSPNRYLSYLAALKGIDKNAAKKRIEQLLDMVVLSDVANKKMKKFSGGMLQRVGIASALLNDPKILILDEPTAGLDPKERVRFRNILSQISANKTVILSTHIVSDIESIATNIIMIKDKRILLNQDGNSICELLKGKVFETFVDSTDGFAHQILSIRQEKDGQLIRFICEGDARGYTEVSPRLEDVFLYIYREESADVYNLGA